MLKGKYFKLIAVIAVVALVVFCCYYKLLLRTPSGSPAYNAVCWGMKISPSFAWIMPSGGAYLEKGERWLTMRFVPVSVYLGLLVSGATALFLLAAVIQERWGRGSNSSNGSNRSNVLSG